MREFEIEERTRPLAVGKFHKLHVPAEKIESEALLYDLWAWPPHAPVIVRWYREQNSFLGKLFPVIFPSVRQEM